MSVAVTMETTYPMETVPTRIRPRVKALPVGLKGWQAIAGLQDWAPVYRDALAELWVRAPDRFPELLNRPFPVQAPPSVTLGRTPFPDTPP